MVRNMEEKSAPMTYENIKEEFVQEVLHELDEVSSEIAERNDEISKRDDYIYGDRIEKSIDIPIGHDLTSVNWLRRTVGIHRDQFMGRGFQVISTYDSKDLGMASEEDPEEANRMLLDNRASKSNAEQRKNIVDAIIKDNGGMVMFQELAESASAVGTAAIKCYYDKKLDRYVMVPIESIENLYAIWSDDNFRDAEAIGYVYQISKRKAIADYGVDEDTPTSPLGSPLKYMQSTTPNFSNQEMVTVVEVTGYISEWKSDKGRVKKCKEGEENRMNVLIVGNKLVRLIDDDKYIPEYYILPNRRERRRPWGKSDISDAAIDINLTYIETLSDWRTAASKVNFPKIKAYGFPNDAELPKPKPRSSELIPLNDGQDLQLLNQGDANQFDFKAQLEELKEQYVRETGISRVFFNDPSVDLNSNQALMTSLKPTTDIAESKKNIWGPVLVEIFTDALRKVALFNPEVKPLVNDDDSWILRIDYPSTLQKEDPIYQQMLLNRFNANTMSLQSYLEAQGESKEELDRIKDEMRDIITASILGKQLGTYVQMSLQPTGFGDYPVEQPGNNQTNPNGGTDMRQQTATQDSNTPGAGVMSQPGSGATPVSPGGALNQAAQQIGA